MFSYPPSIHNPAPAIASHNNVAVKRIVRVFFVCVFAISLGLISCGMTWREIFGFLEVTTLGLNGKEVGDPHRYDAPPAQIGALNRPLNGRFAIVVP